MSVNTKRVCYVKYLADPVFAEILGQRPDVRLDRMVAARSSLRDAPAAFARAAQRGTLKVLLSALD